MVDGRVSVIIAAYEAAETIGGAVASALAQPETAEVIVVIDASPDETAAAAHAADDRSGRLSVLVQPENRGPSAARNRALAQARGDYVAILDADDMFLPGRFAALLAQRDWDIVADDIVFLAEPPDLARLAADLPRGGRSRRLSLGEFVARNIPVRGRPRAELGFLKPVISRAFLDRNGLRYDERLRLGEDFILYARALAAGGRFRLSERCGYVAIQRAGSLSGLHKTADLVALRDASAALQDLPDLAADERKILGAHARNLTVKARYRQMLEDRHRDGPVAALVRLAGTPVAAVPVLAALWRDRRAPAPTSSALPRRLFGSDEFA